MRENSQNETAVRVICQGQTQKTYQCLKENTSKHSLLDEGVEDLKNEDHNDLSKLKQSAIDSPLPLIISISDMSHMKYHST